jgi:hypothetical protein
VRNAWRVHAGQLAAPPAAARAEDEARKQDDVEKPHEKHDDAKQDDDGGGTNDDEDDDEEEDGEGEEYAVVKLVDVRLGARGRECANRIESRPTWRLAALLAQLLTM